MRSATIGRFAIWCSVIVAAPALAQQWSPAQTEVWKNVEAYSARTEARDLEGFLAYVHESYVGWDISEPMTSSKARLRKFLDYNFNRYKTELLDLQPVAINVIDDVAIVYYHFTVVGKDADGKQFDETGRWADILKKQGDKWVLIGDHGGVTSDE